MKQGHTLVPPLNLIENCPLFPGGLILIAGGQIHSDVVRETETLCCEAIFCGSVSVKVMLFFIPPVPHSL